MAVTTSGTVGQTQTDVMSIVDLAFMRCGKLPSTISSELQLAAKRELFLFLSRMANRGRSLWCMQKVVLPATASKAVYDLPVGTVDVYSVQYRTKTDLSGSTISGTGWQGIDLGSGNATTVATVTVAFTTATTPTLAVEYSTDLITWTQAATMGGQSYAAGAAFCGDVDNPVTAQYWRVRDTSGTLATVSALTFSNQPNDLPVTVMSNDDYSALPNKSMTGSKVLQYWYDKQVQPRMWVWPVAQASTDQIVVWTQRQIQDVGVFTNALDVPQYWVDAVIANLAAACVLILPSGEVSESRYSILKAIADEKLQEAEDSQSDGAPIKLGARIAGYTR